MGDIELFCGFNSSSLQENAFIIICRDELWALGPGLFIAVTLGF